MLSKDLITELVRKTVDFYGAKPPEILSSVAIFRIDAFCLCKELGLARFQPEFRTDFNRQCVKDVLQDFAAVVINFPAEVTYGEGRTETPRADAIKRVFEVYEGLDQEGEAFTNACELVKLIGTNDDSEHPKLDYAVLMGIILKILQLLDVDVNTICAEMLSC